jgi:O-antigen ligase
MTLSSRGFLLSLVFAASISAGIASSKIEWGYLLLPTSCFLILGAITIYFKYNLFSILHEIAIIFSIAFLCLSLTSFEVFRFPINESTDIPTYFLIGLPILLSTFVLQIISKAHGFQSNKFIGFQLEFLLPIFILSIASLIIGGRGSIEYTKLIRLAIFIVNYILFALAINTQNLLKKAIWTYVLCSLFLVVLGIYYYYYAPLHWQRLTLSEGRSSNVVAFAINPAILIVFAFVVTANNLSYLKRIVFLTTLIVMLYGLFLTLSRGSWISLGIGILVLSLLSFNSAKRRLAVMTISIFFIGILFITQSSLEIFSQVANYLQAFQDRLLLFQNPFQDESLNSRLVIWEAYWDAISLSPFWGVTQKVSDIFIPHNSFLYFWYEYGLFTVLALIIFLIQHGFQLFSYRRKLITDEQFWCNVFFAIFVMTVAHSFAGEFMAGYFFWFLLGIQTAGINLWYNHQREPILNKTQKQVKITPMILSHNKLASVQSKHMR